jgi:hypothetical protein
MSRAAQVWTRFNPPREPMQMAAVAPQDFAWFAFAADEQVQAVEVRDEGERHVTVTHAAGDCIGAAGMLRHRLLQWHNTDYGLTDEQLVACAAEARAYVGGRRLSWTTIAADRIRAAAEPPARP